MSWSRLSIRRRGICLQCVFVRFPSLRAQAIQYALSAMQNLLDLDYGWGSLDDEFIFHIVRILASPQSLVNVCRPATAILKKLVEADPSSAPISHIVSSPKGSTISPNSIHQYGFAVVFRQMRKESAMLETVVNRLGSADTAMAQYRQVFC